MQHGHIHPQKNFRIARDTIDLMSQPPDPALSQDSSGKELPPDARPRLLLVEDDRALAPLLIEVLAEDYWVDHAPDGQVGLHWALTREYAVMVIDRGLPAIDGLELVSKLRDRGVINPILLLTARGTLADRIEGLDAGAEDYVVKPFEIDELLARLRALLRRHSEATPTIGIGTRRFEVKCRRVVGGGAAPVDLSGKESILLETLARRPGRVFTRPELLSAVFDSNDTEGTVDTYVYYLRRKLGREVVSTVHGLGYRIGSL
jgi:two-component system response regulator QseB